jgi:hypothetical protein
LGRLSEALDPMRVGVKNFVTRQDWKQAAAQASNLSELELTLGEMAAAVGTAEQCVTYADRSGDAFQRVLCRATLADSQHQVGRKAGAEARFREAEAMQAADDAQHPRLYSVNGFQFCDLLLAVPERAAWAGTLQCGNLSSHSSVLGAISQRAAQTLSISERNNWLLTIALDHLTLSRAALYTSILESRSPQLPISLSHITAAVGGLRLAGAQHHLPRSLLTRAWLRSLPGAPAGLESAQEDLDEAWEIAERGPMKLFMADIHLYRSRLFHGVTPYPWTSPQEDLAAARKLIEQCGYWRRKEELEDAEAAAKNW